MEIENVNTSEPFVPIEIMKEDSIMNVQIVNTSPVNLAQILMPTKPQPGDVFLYRRNTFLSKAIQWFEKCPWSHASLAFDIYGEILVSEAEAKGLVANDIATSIKGCEMLLLRPKFEVDPVVLSKFVAPNLGKHRYGFIRLTIVQIVWQLFHKWILNEGKHDELKRVICGEWVAYTYYKLSGEKYFLRWYRDTPASLFESDLFEHYTLEQ